MSAAESFRNNPGKYILGSAGSIIAIVTALFAIDSRYAHAADVEKDKEQTQMVIKDTALIIRKQSLEDKLFEYDVKKEQSPSRTLTPLDSALQQRYKRQLDDLKTGKPLN